MLQEREAEAKHHEMEAAQREAMDKAKEYEDAREQVPSLRVNRPLLKFQVRHHGGSVGTANQGAVSMLSTELSGLNSIRTHSASMLGLPPQKGCSYYVQQ